MPAERVTLHRTNVDKTEVIEQYPKTIAGQVYDLENEKFLNETLGELKGDISDRGINIKNPPKPLVAAIGDGVANDTSSVKSCAQLANALGVPLIIPSGSYYINEKITITTDVLCYGEFVTNNNIQVDYLIEILPKLAPIVVDSSTLSNLNSGSSSISGLNNFNGATVRFVSSEILINRDHESNSPYRKRDTSYIISDNGGISPPLDCGYSEIGNLTVTVYPYEKPIEINGLKIRTIGDIGSPNLISIKRSNTNIKGVSISNDSKIAKIETGIRLEGVSNISFYDLNINGLSALNSQGITGYGVSVSESSNISFFNCKINDCRHAISGRHGKNILIKGGNYSRNIDSHWCNGLTVEDVVIISSQTEAGGAISYAGSNVTIRNVKVFGKYLILLSIRNDTPELAGVVHIENVSAKVDGSYFSIVRYTTSTSNFNFGKIVQNPKSLIIKDVYVDAPITTYIAGLEGSYTRNYNQTKWGKISVDNIQTANKNPLTAVYMGKNPDFEIGTEETEIFIKNINFNAGTDNTTLGLRLRSSDNGVSDKGFNVYIVNCKGLSIKTDISSYKKIKIVDCELETLFGRFFNSSPLIGDIEIKDSIIKNVSFEGNFKFIFKNCVWSGVTTTTGTNITNKTLVSSGNLALIGATGFPALDGIKDTSIYQ